MTKNFSKILSDSPLKTRKLGRLLAKETLREWGEKPIIIGLTGNLGSGKTTFIQGFAEGLGLRNRITSPTFVIFRHYKLRTKNRKHLFHMDAYRIGKVSELKPLNFKDVISEPQGLVLIEWPEKIKRALPKETIWLEFRHGRKESERIIRIR